MRVGHRNILVTARHAHPDGKTGTEHEFETAYKSWKTDNQRPEILAYFCERPAKPKSAEDREQLKMVQNFKTNFPKEAFAWQYTNLGQFKTLVARHVRQYVREQVQSIWNKDALRVREMLEERKNEPATIAILGRVNAGDHHYDKPIVYTEECRQNLFEIGKQLAIAGCHIMVYDSRPQYAATEVVAGYVKSGVAHDKSIRVRRPLSLVQAPFPGQTHVSTSHLFKDDPTPEEAWEIAFMPSLPESDGVIVVGNGQFTLQGGLQAVGGKLPLVVLLDTEVSRGMFGRRSVASAIALPMMMSFRRWPGEAAIQPGLQNASGSCSPKEVAATRYRSGEPEPRSWNSVNEGCYHADPYLIQRDGRQIMAFWPQARGQGPISTPYQPQRFEDAPVSAASGELSVLYFPFRARTPLRMWV